jgi:uncharacterized protein YjbI with pentapeptide repeats
VNEKLTHYLNKIFAPYDESLRAITDLKQELLQDLQERIDDLQKQGVDETTAFRKAVDSLGDIEQTIHDLAERSQKLQRVVLTNFSKTHLAHSDFRNISVHDAKFEQCDLRESDFSHSDLTGSSFKGSDLRKTEFADADLTGANLTGTALSDVSFSHARLAKADLSASDLRRTVFQRADLTGTKLRKVALGSAAVFQDCTLVQTDFSFSDVSGIHFDNQTLVGVIFDGTGLVRTSFKHATLRNVSFRMISKRYVRKAVFTGAAMDKVTYAFLKGAGADLDHVTIIKEDA